MIYFSKREMFYYLRFQLLLEFWNRAKNGGRKSFRFEELENDFFLAQDNPMFVPYLDGVARDLALRD